MERKPDNGATGLGIACGIGAGAMWGLVFLAPELARAFGPLHLAIGRYLSYGALSAVLIAPRWRTLVSRLTRREWGALAWLALAGNTLYYVFLSSAVQWGGIATTSLVIGLLPVAVTIIGSRDRDAVPLHKLAPSLLLCAASALCIGWQSLGAPSSGTSGPRMAGLLCAFGALVSWTAFAVGNSRWLRRLEHVSVHDWNLLTGLVTGAQALVLLPVALALDTTSHGRAAWVGLAGVSIGVAVLASLVGNALWNRMSRLLPLTLVGQMILFETLFALLYAFLWERRLPAPLEVAAFVLVVSSVLACIAAHRNARA
ncbi:DMT family transporter [Myxococcus sp. K15C18031901]|uniref:DMT family transporter n=1 Tax=Myxococcus dinghuensis TaxID=2906761 RepID=UPI0020A78E5B|nr:EamA family transporter [Myxococcus dinghuensis]MCP3097840.1 DMT family transporter [Myxococcus dinghuensis]